MARFLAGEVDSMQMDMSFSPKDGDVRWAHFTSSLQRDDAGGPLYVFSSVANITNQVQAAAQVAEINAVLEQRVEERTRDLTARER